MYTDQFITSISTECPSRWHPEDSYPTIHHQHVASDQNIQTYIFNLTVLHVDTALLRGSQEARTWLPDLKPRALLLDELFSVRRKAEPYDYTPVISREETIKCVLRNKRNVERINSDSKYGKRPLMWFTKKLRHHEK